MTVSLPLAGAAPTAGPATPDAPAAAASRRVLVVDDEPAIRSLVRRILERAGYQATEAPHGAAAAALLRAGTPVDLLLADTAMAELTGIELARRAATLRPGLPVLLMSGYAERASASP